MEKKWPTMLKYLPRSVFDWAMRSCNDRKDKIIMASGTWYVDLTVYLAESNKTRTKNESTLHTWTLYFMGYYGTDMDSCSKEELVYVIHVHNNIIKNNIYIYNSTYSVFFACNSTLLCSTRTHVHV